MTVTERDQPAHWPAKLVAHPGAPRAAPAQTVALFRPENPGFVTIATISSQFRNTGWGAHLSTTWSRPHCTNRLKQSAPCSQQRAGGGRVVGRTMSGQWGGGREGGGGGVQTQAISWPRLCINPCAAHSPPLPGPAFPFLHHPHSYPIRQPPAPHPLLAQAVPLNPCTAPTNPGPSSSLTYPALPGLLPSAAITRLKVEDRAPTVARPVGVRLHE